MTSEFQIEYKGFTGQSYFEPVIVSTLGFRFFEKANVPLMNLSTKARLLLDFILQNAGPDFVFIDDKVTRSSANSYLMSFEGERKGLKPKTFNKCRKELILNGFLIPNDKKKKYQLNKELVIRSTDDQYHHAIGPSHGEGKNLMAEKQRLVEEREGVLAKIHKLRKHSYDHPDQRNEIRSKLQSLAEEQRKLKVDLTVLGQEAEKNALAKVNELYKRKSFVVFNQALPKFLALNTKERSLLEYLIYEALLNEGGASDGYVFQDKDLRAKITKHFADLTGNKDFMSDSVISRGMQVLDANTLIVKLGTDRDKVINPFFFMTSSAESHQLALGKYMQQWWDEERYNLVPVTPSDLPGYQNLSEEEQRVLQSNRILRAEEQERIKKRRTRKRLARRHARIRARIREKKRYNRRAKKRKLNKHESRVLHFFAKSSVSTASSRQR